VLWVMYLMYDGVRLVVSAGNSEAFMNAHRILRLERFLGVGDESPVNHTVSATPVLGVPLSYAYAALHYLVTPIVLVWLWRSRPERYRGARTALVTATLIGLLGFWLFPTAPPRMMPGFVDTLARYDGWGWWAGAASAPKGLAGLTNEYAAMPSLHVGWAAWCGWQIACGSTRRWLQVLGVVYPVFMVFVVVGTANHYVADAVAGLMVIIAGALIARFRERLRGHASR
jgi:PAP2 superfamily